MKHSLLKAKWITHGSDVWLKEMAIGRTLHICCGMSQIGDIKADIDPKTNRNFTTDLFNLPFKPRTFDTVICDPPYSYYNRFKWFYNLSHIADKRFIIASGLQLLRLGKKNWKRQLFYDSSARSPITGGNRIFLKLWWVFDRVNANLDEAW